MHGGTLEISGRAEATSSDAADACFAIVSVMLEQIAGRRIPIRVTLVRPTPPNLERYLNQFGAVRFAADRNTLTVPVEVIDLPLAAGDPKVREVLDHYAKTLLGRRNRGWRTKVERCLNEASDTLSLEETARRLSVSPRTLQSRLSAEGTSYSAIVDQSRRNYALEMLQTTNLTLEAVARSAGLGSASALSRAVKRWTGESPQAIRQARNN
ncbi:MAG TPA: helix-turn-helix domain-containing protein [Marmoricola sp.]|nr:helix-turn-helix domain-containing protein [Marmoricola sp.]